MSWACSTKWEGQKQHPEFCSGSVKEKKTLKIPNHTFEGNNKVDAKENVLVWIRFMKLNVGLWRMW